MSATKVSQIDYVAIVDGEGNVTASSAGATSDEAWNGTDADASVVSILKACYEQLVIIATNTTPAA